MNGDTNQIARAPDQIPTMEMLEKEVGMLREQVSLVTDQFQRIYAIVPEPNMKNDPTPNKPESLEPKRLMAVIRDIDKINMGLRVLESQIAATMNSLVGEKR